MDSRPPSVLKEVRREASRGGRPTFAQRAQQLATEQPNAPLLNPPARPALAPTLAPQQHIASFAQQQLASMFQFALQQLSVTPVPSFMTQLPSNPSHAPQFPSYHPQQASSSIQLPQYPQPNPPPQAQAAMGHMLRRLQIAQEGAQKLRRPVVPVVDNTVKKRDEIVTPSTHLRFDASLYGYVRSTLSLFVHPTHH